MYRTPQFRFSPTPPPKPVEIRVVKVADGYEIRQDGELVGFDTRRREANQAACYYEQFERQRGRAVANYPAFED